MTTVSVKRKEKEFLVQEGVHAEFWEDVNSRLWEIATFEAFSQFIRSNHCYVDIGSWIGPTVLFGAQLAQECFAVEPDPVAFEELKKNVDCNKALKDKIHLFNGCISNVSGVEHFGTQSSFGDSMSSLIYAKNENAIEVEALTLEDYFDKFRIQGCNFIKIDVEGGEAKILPQARKFLGSFKPTLFLALHSQWFENRNRSAEEIVEALGVYDQVYTAYGRKLSLNQLKHDMTTQGKISEVIATDVTWPVFQRGKYQRAIALQRAKKKLIKMFGKNNRRK